MNSIYQKTSKEIRMENEARLRSEALNRYMEEAEEQIGIAQDHYSGKVKWLYQTLIALTIIAIASIAINTWLFVDRYEKIELTAKVKK